MSKRWTNRPEGSNWGDFGADDQKGRMNLLTPERVRAAVAEVKEGRTFCLSMPLDRPGGAILNPRRYPPVLEATKRGAGANYVFPLSKDNELWTDVVCDDAVFLHLQYSTQWDSFAHVGAMFDADGDGVPEARFYNGWRGGEDVVGPTDGHGLEGVRANRLGIENMAEACVQGRGVMIDLFESVGAKRTYVDFDMLSDVMKAQGVTVETGDLVCLHTGFARAVLAADGAPDAALLHDSHAVLDGRDKRLREWITDSGLAALIADNYAVEGLPSRPGGEHAHAFMPIHEHCLFKLGVHLGELWHLSELCDWLRAQGRTRFLLTAPPLRLPGAVGSPATPIATV